MLIMGERLPNGIVLRGDVCIVGSGPAGITLARELRRAGLRVVVLESGDRRTYGPANELLRGQSVGYPFSLENSRRRAFGGTSSHWTAETGLRVRPLDEVDLMARAVNGGIGWPMPHRQLAPWIDQAMESLGLPVSFDPAVWHPEESDAPGAWPPRDHLAMFMFANHRTFAEMYDELAEAHGIELVLNATVVDLETDPDDGHVTRVAAASLEGNRFHVVAKQYVLACGGIDNARILLASPGRTGTGVGNEHDLVGRYFMDHLSIDSGFVRVAPNARLPWVSLYEEQQHPSGTKIQSMHWNGSRVAEERGLLNAAFWINHESEDLGSPGVQSLRALRGAVKVRPLRATSVQYLPGVIAHPVDVSRFTWARFSNHARAPRLLTFRIMAEQAPNRRSRIRLSGQRDRLGVPMVQLDWQLSDVDKWSIRQQQDVLDELLQASGFAPMERKFGDERPAGLISSNYHHMGTTRMHPDPRQGVVDVDGRVHSAPNLFVAGSSVFPIGGYVNPTLTIIALALRLAERLKTESRAVWEPLAVS